MKNDMEKVKKILGVVVSLVFVAILMGFASFFKSNEAEQKVADRFAGSEALWLMDKLAEQGLCITYTQEEVQELYVGKKVEERRIMGALLENKWQCE